MTPFEPKTLSESAATIGVYARAIADAGLAGRETAARLLTMDEPDLIEVVVLVNALRLGGDRGSAWQLLQAVSVIVVAGGWPAVVADPIARKSWDRAMRKRG